MAEIQLKGDVGRWVHVNGDYQDYVPDGAIGVIVREYKTDPDMKSDNCWDVFVMRTDPDNPWVPVHGTIVSVPRGSQEILKVVRI